MLRILFVGVFIFFQLNILPCLFASVRRLDLHDGVVEIVLFGLIVLLRLRGGDLAFLLQVDVIVNSIVLGNNTFLFLGKVVCDFLLLQLGVGDEEFLLVVGCCTAGGSHAN